MLLQRIKMLSSFPSKYDLDELDALAEVAPAQTTKAIVELFSGLLPTGRTPSGHSGLRTQRSSAALRVSWGHSC